MTRFESNKRATLSQDLEMGCPTLCKKEREKFAFDAVKQFVKFKYVAWANGSKRSRFDAIFDADRDFRIY